MGKSDRIRRGLRSSMFAAMGRTSLLGDGPAGEGGTVVPGRAFFMMLVGACRRCGRSCELAAISLLAVAFRRSAGRISRSREVEGLEGVVLAAA